MSADQMLKHNVRSIPQKMQLHFPILFESGPHINGPTASPAIAEETYDLVSLVLF
jgi:hypothetical protein